MPFTFSIVLSTQNSGAICTMPPIDTTHQDADQQEERVLLEDFVFHGAPPIPPAAGAAPGAAAMRGCSAASTGSSPRTVRQTL